MEHSPLTDPKFIPRLPEIVGTEFKAHWREGMSNEDYHADRSAISSSALKILLQKTPAHFKSAWMSGMAVDDEKECFRYGSLAHCALLEPQRFKDQFIMEPKFEGFTKDGRLSTQSKEAKDLKKAWYANLAPGSLVVTPEDHKAITGTIQSILAHQKASKVIEGAKTEISGFFRHEATGIKCRLRPDILHIDKRIIIDFKTTRDASRDFFSREIAKHMYHVSLAFHGMGVKAIEGWEPELYAWLPAEKEEPFACALYVAKKETIETARAWIEHGMSTLKQCLEMDKWPSHQDGAAEEIDIPEWEHMRNLPLFDFEEEE